MSSVPGEITASFNLGQAQGVQDFLVMKESIASTDFFVGTSIFVKPIF